MKHVTRRRLVILLCSIALIAGLVIWSRGATKELLVVALQHADRIEVRTQAAWTDDNENSTPFVLQGRSYVEEFLRALRPKASIPLFSTHCGCRGDTVFEFFADSMKVVTLTFHHGSHLRWHHGQWDSDVYLTTDSQSTLATWFKEHGYGRLQSIREEKLAKQKRKTEETEKFYSFFPHSRVELLSGAPKELAKAAFRALSVTSLRLGETGTKEEEVIAALSRVSATDIVEAASSVQDDSEALLGFARLFFFHGFNDIVPEESRELWALRLAKVVLSKGIHENKSYVVRYLWRIRDPEADRLLDGAVDRADSSAESASRGDSVEPSLHIDAALALAVRGSDIEKRVVTMLDGQLSKIDRAALEVALAISGDPSYLRKEHFAFPSFSVGFAGLRAIERYDGARGMDALIDGAFEHPRFAVVEEAVLVFERITGHQVWNRAPRSLACWYKNDAVAWWKANGEEFVNKRRESLGEGTPTGSEK